MHIQAGQKKLKKFQYKRSSLQSKHDKNKMKIQFKRNVPFGVALHSVLVLLWVLEESHVYVLLSGDLGGSST